MGSIGRFRTGTIDSIDLVDLVDLSRAEQVEGRRLGSEWKTKGKKGTRFALQSYLQRY